MKINEVVYMAYGHQESAVPFFLSFFFFLPKVASNLLKKKEEEREGNYTCAALAAQWRADPEVFLGGNNGYFLISSKPSRDSLRSVSEARPRWPT